MDTVVSTTPELRALQLDRLRWSLRHAYDNVPHYRAAFDAAGVMPDDLRGLDDLARFPFTGKADLRANYPFGMFAVPREEVVRVHASSGTTGKPTVVGYTRDDIDTWAEVMARSIEAAGGRPGDLLHVIYGYGLFTGGLGAHYGAERLGCTVVPVSGGMTERQVQLILDFQPRIVMVTPSYFLAILDEMQAQGVDPRSTSLEIGIFGAEPWTEQMRQEVQERSNIRAVDIYGLSEVMGPGVSQESGQTQDGLHIWEDHFYPEVIDPVTGEVLPDGQEGELVFTSLTKQAMPVVRYRTRDLTTLLPGTAYPQFRRMARITGRTDDMMIVRGVNVFPSQIEEHLLAVDGLAPHYLCVLTRPGRMDELTVQVEASDAASTGEARAGMARELQRRVKEHVGVTVQVEVLEPHALERSLGKARRISDRRRT
jgi:phenylacetate-CoA ligase